MRKKESLEFMKDGWKKYRMMLYAGANMECYFSNSPGCFGSFRGLLENPAYLGII